MAPMLWAYTYVMGTACARMYIAAGANTPPNLPTRDRGIH
jgi:hypothetical protein